MSLITALRHTLCHPEMSSSSQSTISQEGLPVSAQAVDQTSSIIRQRLVFEGRVQGVGFRYTMQSVCSSLGLTGWVHNEYDGTVCAEIQGTLIRVHSVPSSMKDRYKAMPISFTVQSCKEIPLVPGERSFYIRY